MNSQISELIEECSYKDKIRIFCGTFNVNSKSPNEDLKAWLLSSTETVDIYSIGFQEVVDLNTSSFLLQSDWAERESSWIAAINQELINPEENLNYILKEKIRMFGLLLLIYVKDEEWNKSIYDVFKAEVATGIMDTVGNKGSVGISMKVHETRICFVCSHFAADTEKVSKRNSDYRSTKQRLRFEYNANLDYYDLESHDIVFWFGDLNYRIDSLNLVKTLNLIYTNDLDELIKNDQLTNEKLKLNSFEDYNEGAITFRPTYKYLCGQDTYAKQESIKSSPTPNELSCDRIAYTDRVLWRTSQNLNVNLQKYSCINTITISDHKPVYALFEVEVKRIDIAKYNKKYDEFLKLTDKKQNDEMPNITIEQHEHKFSDCLFYDQQTFSFQIKNKGLRLTTVGIRFYDPSSSSDLESNNLDVNRTSHTKPNQWIEINPQVKEKLAPGSEYKVELKTNLNSNNLKRLNKNAKLDDFLIISCLNGNDLFFTSSIQYIRTIIGYSLKGLATLSKDETFTNTDLDLLNIKEDEIEEFELHLNELWLTNLRKITHENEEYKLQAMIKKENTPFVLSKTDIYKKCLSTLKNEIVFKDKSYNNDLSAEYEFLINYLIKRCESTETLKFNEEPIEIQKNNILKYLSAKHYEQLEKDFFEIEILIEVLKDLLYALPSSLIPNRYIDYLQYANNGYKDYLLILNYIPRSHLKLFELIVKFLQVYSNVCPSDYSFIFANAIFRINCDMTKLFDTANRSADIDSFKRQTADSFLKLFIENHK